MKSLIELLRESESNKLWYHGSKIKFDKFKLKAGTLLDASYISPIFLTSNEDFAKEYAGHQTPYIYTVKILTDNIMDFRKLPSTYDLEMYNVKGKLSDKPGRSDVKYYEIGNQLLEYIEDKFPDEYTDKMYDDLLDGDYSSIERDWVYDWLKENKYDGAYVIETRELNVFIFDESKLKILSVKAA